jgi:diadenosine tetraphosphate (Ap4A) HIT family hydrolase/predicted house-cleaning noncanonical NTP pyrophosphatase (MazG superfamily)
MSSSRERFHYKLVRDLTPEILQRQNIISFTTNLDKEAFALALSEKLREEVEEYLHAPTPEGRLEELADVLEVIHALLGMNNATFKDLEDLRRTKFEQRGGFSKHIFLEKTHEADAIQAPHPSVDCLFCKMGRNEHQVVILEKFNHCYVIQDAFPVSQGHVLIIPYEHTENWFTAKHEVQCSIIKALNQMKSRLDEQYQPAGYNIGMNCGIAAGQTIPHLHVHLIPRYEGDMEDPKGGVRGVIPHKQKY